MKYTYRWGQRPLDGYTIKRGLGTGGFGEVYFALSDGGKEVALKLIRGHTDTELRGIANCLNFKHPNLVHLYDLRKDAKGDHWLVMEYVHGEPLNAILHRHPNGLQEAQARKFFLEAAHAVAYLHDHAVVHRDIKPANLFVESGTIKLGDYGLSKSVSASQHNQSCNVGTIHYMAPEITSGNYSRQVDVYACGVMLFEMLTGEVPFRGESWNEIAIKHQTDLPDMSKVPEAYRAILERALDKKATRRFQDINEMIHAVEAIGRENRPLDELSITRTHIPESAPRVVPAPQVNGRAPAAVIPAAVPLAIPGWRNKLSELTRSLALAPLPALPVVGAWALYTQSLDWSAIGPLCLTIVAMTWAIVIATKAVEGGERKLPNRIWMVLIGVVVGIGAFWVDGWTLPKILMRGDPPPPAAESYLGGSIQMSEEALEALTGYVIYFALALGVLRWWQTSDRRRGERFSLFPMLAAGFWGVLLLILWKWFPTPPAWAVLALAGTAGAVQLVSPWSPPAPAPKRPRRLAEIVPA